MEKKTEQRPADKEWKPVAEPSHPLSWCCCLCGKLPCLTFVLLLYLPPHVLDYVITHVAAQPLLEVASLGLQQPIDKSYHPNKTTSGKHVLIVGGTKGIGRGIAEELLRPGHGAAARVTVVGRDQEAFLELRESVQYNDPGSTEADYDSRRLQFVAADLSTIEACRQAAKQLASLRGQGDGRFFDKVVFTVGAWPHFDEPITTDGYDRVVHLDVIARHTLLMELYGSGLLRRGEEDGGGLRSTVISVLAASRWQPGMHYSDDDLKFYLRNWLEDDGAQLAERHWTKWLATLPFVAETCDIWLKKAAEEMPGVDFVGTFPGLVKTEVSLKTLGGPVFHLAQLLPIWTNIFTAGRQHLMIMGHAQVLIEKQRAAKTERPPNLAFFDHKRYARRGNNVERDAYGDWLWKLLETLRSEEGRVQRESPAKKQQETGKDEL